MKAPLVSIAIPAYNSEGTIIETLQSASAQSHQELEIIVVNDGSTDSTLELAKNFLDERIKIVSSENRGLAGAQNLGTKHAIGEYISFIDADDL